MIEQGCLQGHTKQVHKEEEQEKGESEFELDAWNSSDEAAGNKRRRNRSTTLQLHTSVPCGEHDCQKTSAIK